jgi:FKBP-type peptidyl-prolyl cis-trans isomerase (trigger factor)
VRLGEAASVPFEAELDSMLAEYRRRRAAEVEREASARAGDGAEVDLLAWKRLDRVLNGRGDED